MNYKLLFLDKFKKKTAKISIIGMGYVGLPLALRYVEEGFTVFGIDVDQSKIQKLLKKESYIKHIPEERIAGAINKSFKPTTSFEVVEQSDAILICVPTPLTIYREPDLSYVKSTMQSVIQHLHKGQLISLESTTYPGTTHELIERPLKQKGFHVGEDFFVVFSPEREDPGRQDFTTSTIPKVIGGASPACLEAGIAVYSGIIEKIVPVSSTQTAEMSKLLENIHRAVNIGLVNEMKIVCDRMGIDIHEVIDAAATKPFGFVAYRPGPGLGGHCIPIDPFYLTWKAREYGINTKFIELAGEINSSMPNFVVEKTIQALNNRKKSVSGASIIILGLSYKKNIDDYRESPSFAIISALLKLGGKVSYADPFFKDFPRSHEHDFDIPRVELNKETLKGADLVLISTDHDSFPYELILECSDLIVDTRGRYSKLKSDKVVSA